MIEVEVKPEAEEEVKAEDIKFVSRFPCWGVFFRIARIRVSKRVESHGDPQKDVL